MKRKLALIVILTLTAALMLQACGGSGGGGAATTAAAATEAATTTTAAATTTTAAATTEKATEAGASGLKGAAEGAVDLGGGVFINPPGVFPIVPGDKPYEMKVWMPFGANIIVEGNLLLEHWEKMTNIKVTYMEASSDGAEQSQQVNLMLASGADLPDAFSYNMGMQRLTTYGNAGVFLEMSDYIDKWTVNVQHVWDETKPYGKSVCLTMDGKLYGLPSFNGCFHCNYSNRGWINQVWLDNLGLPMPTTTDEYYETLKAFKEQDANGNGNLTDEVPLIGMTNGWNTKIENFLMNAFVTNRAGNANTLNRVNIVGDKLEAAYMTDGWKEGLKFYRKLYEEGLLDPECFVMDTTGGSMLASDPAGNRVGSFFSGVSTQVGGEGEIPWAWSIIPPLKGPKGVQSVAFYPDFPSVKWVVTSAAKHPEIAVRWGDSWLEDNIEFIVLTRGGLGDTPASFFIDPAVHGTVIGQNDQPAIYYTDPNRLWLETNLWIADANPGFTSNYSRECVAYNLGDSSEYDLEKVILLAAKLYEKFKPEKVLPPLQYSDKEIDRVNELMTMINTYVEENFAAFVTGQRNIDSDWDSYIKELNSMGVEELLGYMTAAWKDQFK